MKIEEAASLLGVVLDRTITLRSVTRAFRKQSVLMHPDKKRERDRQQATINFARLNTAYMKAKRFLVDGSNEWYDSDEWSEDESEETDHDDDQKPAVKLLLYSGQSGDIVLKAKAGSWKHGLSVREDTRATSKVARIVEPSTSTTKNRMEKNGAQVYVTLSRVAKVRNCPCSACCLMEQWSMRFHAIICAIVS